MTNVNEAPTAITYGNVIADYRDDFRPDAPLVTGWQYLWNAPNGWTAGGSNNGTNAIGNPSGYVALQDSGTLWTVDGDTNFTNDTAGRFAMLNSTGGHPGVGTNEYGFGASRAAIGAFTIATTGTYSITDSFFQSTNPASTDGLTLYVHVDSNAFVETIKVTPSQSRHFNISLGTLTAGQTVYVVASPDAFDGSDAFAWDYSIRQEATLAVAENATNGTVITSVRGIDEDIANTQTYSLTSNAGGRFAIDGSTGLITVNNGSLLDFETATNHQIVVRSTDGSGSFVERTLTINLSNANEGPVAVAESATAAEAGGTNNGTAGTNPTGNVLTNDTDVDAGDTKAVTGVVAGTSASASGSVGASVTGTYGSINIAADGTYTYTVNNSNAAVQALAVGQSINDVFTYTMRDTAGLTSTTPITVTIQGANDAPTDITGTLSIAENSANSTLVGTVATTDIDTGDTFTYALTNNAGGRFAVNNAGQITVANSSLLNAEANSFHTIVVQTTDAAGLTFQKTMTVQVTSVNEAAVDLVLSQHAGTVNVADDFNDGTIDTSKWSVNNSANSGFSAVAEQSGSIVLTQRGYLNSASPFAPVATNGIRISGEVTFASSGDFLQIVTRGSGTPTGPFGEISEGVKFYISPQSNSIFVNGSGGAMALVTGATYRFEVIDTGSNLIFKVSEVANPFNSVTVTSTSSLVSSTNLVTFYNRESAGSVATLDNIAIRTGVNASTVAIAENSSNGTVVATAISRDIDGNNASTFSLTNDASGRFAIDSSTGQITVASSSSLDFDTTSNHVITVRTTDAGGLTYDENFTIALTNVNEAPTANVDSATAVEAGGTANGTAGSNPTGNVLTNDTDVDAGDTKTVSGVVAGTSASGSGSVGAGVAGTYGTINIATDGTYTYTVDNSNAAVQALRLSSQTLADTFTYTMRDTAGLTSTTQITVTIQGANDAPSDVVATKYLSSLTPSANVNLYVFSTGTAAIDGVTYSTLFTHPHGGTATGSNTGTSFGYVDYAIGDSTSFKAIIGLQDAAAGNVRYMVYVDGNLRYTSPVVGSSNAGINLNIDTTGGTTLRLAVDNGNGASDFDWAHWANARLEGGTIPLTIAENASNGSVVGSISSVDVDSVDNAAYSLTDNAGGRFAINSGTGQITVADGTLLNFEAATSHTIVVRATDVGGLTFDKTLTIDVTNINEAPVAVADTATAVEAGGIANAAAGTNPTGSVLTNDTDVDASDTKTVSGVVAGTSASASGSVGAGVAGTYGTISIAADGTYSYTVDNNNSAVQALRTTSNTLSDVYTYTMRDAAGLTSTTQITVTIQGANDAPTITSNGGDSTASLTVNENQTAVTTVIGNDVDAGTTRAYSIVGGADSNHFAVNSSTGALTFIGNRDAELPGDANRDGVYIV